jgi:4-diphosphocytidyl-2C-methyl-D-erythritol kinase
LKGTMASAGTLGAIMTGSGSAILGLCRNEAHAREVAARVSDVFWRVEVAAGTERGAEVVED